MLTTQSLLETSFSQNVLLSSHYLHIQDKMFLLDSMKLDFNPKQNQRTNRMVMLVVPKNIVWKQYLLS